MHSHNHSFSRSASLPTESRPITPNYHGHTVKSGSQIFHKPTPITPPLSPGHSESSDDDDYLLNDDTNEGDEDCIEAQESVLCTKSLTPVRSDYSSIYIDPQLSSDEKPQAPLRLLENEQVHLHFTGPGGIRLSDFEVRGTLGL